MVISSLGKNKLKVVLGVEGRMDKSFENWMSMTKFDSVSLEIQVQNTT